jgi:hypothetical protein
VSKNIATITCVKPPPEKLPAQNPHPYKRLNTFTETTGNEPTKNGNEPTGNGNDPTAERNNKPTPKNEPR